MEHGLRSELAHAALGHGLRGQGLPELCEEQPRAGEGQRALFPCPGGKGVKVQVV